MPAMPSRALVGSVALVAAALLFDRWTYTPADPWHGLASFAYFGIVPEAILAICSVAHLLFGRGHWQFRTMILAAVCAFALANLVLLERAALPAAISAYYFPCGFWLMPALVWYWATRWHLNSERRPRSTAAR